MNRGEAEKNNNLPIIIGACLILAVALFTVLKSQLFSGPNNNDSARSVQNISANSDNKNAISSSQLAQKITDKENIKVVDIRDTQSYKAEHILDSVNINPQYLSAYITNTSETKNFILIDNDGTASSGIINSLSNSNKDAKVYYLIGGFLDWQNQSEPTISFGDPNSFTDQAKVKYITSDELKKLLDQSANLYIIDVRTSDDYNAGHIKNSVNIFLDDLEKRRNEIPPGKQIILYDNNSLQAFSGAVRLFDMGDFGAMVLSDGFTSWAKKGYDVAK